jgi:hypothetical protein
MRIIIAWGKEEDLLNRVIPRSYRPTYKVAFKNRMDWIIRLMEKDSGKSIEQLR